MTEPRTEAGKLLAHEYPGVAYWPQDDDRSFVETIETEAADAALLSLKEAVGGLERYEAASPLVYVVTPKGSTIELAAVLALIDERLTRRETE